ncbi:hypothetical protein F5884DRAFT_682283 [Xylogone sp. PMI_703]|nr:hypothetical protein F5884DRAFT_682283 [Xylogone sp. PMI_703]
MVRATGRDSSQMRSISIITMVFLPGTFFATLFSMTFFNWSPSDGGAIVSHYVWIYFVMTAVSTIIALPAWWYFLVYRQTRSRQSVSKTF